MVLNVAKQSEPSWMNSSAVMPLMAKKVANSF